jgi:signal transduction histidine kinase
MADPTEIHQILMNLGTNGGHAMHEKGGTLTIDLRPIEINEDMLMAGQRLTPGAYVQLSVTDTGHGIPAELIDRVFEPFFYYQKPR